MFITMADLLNTERTVEFEGKQWKLRQPTIDEEAEFSVWLEQEAYNAIERRTYQNEKQKEIDRDNLNDAVACGEYEYGGPVAVRACNLPKGIAGMLKIVCHKQGMTMDRAKRMVDHKLKEIAIAFASKAREMDPKTLAGILMLLGFPADYLSSGSAIPHLIDPLTNLEG